MSFTVVVGHAVKEMDKVRQQISRRRVVIRGMSSSILVARALLYINSEIDELWSTGSLDTMWPHTSVLR